MTHPECDSLPAVMETAAPKERIEAKIEELRGTLYPLKSFAERNHTKAVIQGLELALEMLDENK